MCKRYRIKLNKNRKIKNKNSTVHISFGVYNTAVHDCVEYKTLKCRNAWFSVFIFFFFLIKLICAGWGPSEFIPPPTLRINSRFFKRKVRKELAAIFQKKKKVEEWPHMCIQITHGKRTLKTQVLKDKESLKRIGSLTFQMSLFLVSGILWNMLFSKFRYSSLV